MSSIARTMHRKSVCDAFSKRGASRERKTARIALLSALLALVRAKNVLDILFTRARKCRGVDARDSLAYVFSQTGWLLYTLSPAATVKIIANLLPFIFYTSYCLIASAKFSNDFCQWLFFQFFYLLKLHHRKIGRV